MEKVLPTIRFQHALMNVWSTENPLFDEKAATACSMAAWRPSTILWSASRNLGSIEFTCCCIHPQSFRHLNEDAAWILFFRAAYWCLQLRYINFYSVEFGKKTACLISFNNQYHFALYQYLDHNKRHGYSLWQIVSCFTGNYTDS